MDLVYSYYSTLFLGSFSNFFGLIDVFSFQFNDSNLTDRYRSYHVSSIQTDVGQSNELYLLLSSVLSVYERTDFRLQSVTCQDFSCKMRVSVKPSNLSFISQPIPWNSMGFTLDSIECDQQSLNWHTCKVRVR